MKRPSKAELQALLNDVIDAKFEYQEAYAQSSQDSVLYLDHLMRVIEVAQIKLDRLLRDDYEPTNYYDGKGRKVKTI